MSSVQWVTFPPRELTVMFLVGKTVGTFNSLFIGYLIMGTLMSGWVFKQKERMEMQMKKTEITPITWK